MSRKKSQKSKGSSSPATCSVPPTKENGKAAAETQSNGMAMSGRPSLSNSGEFYDIAFKVMLVGDSGVGKTCLLVRFKDGAFLAGSFISTVGIDFRSAEPPKPQARIIPVLDKGHRWSQPGFCSFKSAASESRLVHKYLKATNVKAIPKPNSVMHTNDHQKRRKKKRRRTGGIHMQEAYLCTCATTCVPEQNGISCLLLRGFLHLIFWENAN
ncbi:ras-related protein Rab-26 isoform X2 [Ranitomeya variabilis]|uniref:ras-related protein Rab-26 isoform X2 n=1 Tax=Ranitomeya variabilis TaxID=490064 RepID=UPI00405644E9